MRPADFLTVADGLPDPLLLIDRGGRVLAANRAFGRFLGG
jgi:PAS domain-containing protein